MPRKIAGGPSRAVCMEDRKNLMQDIGLEAKANGVRRRTHFIDGMPAMSARRIARIDAAGN